MLSSSKNRFFSLSRRFRFRTQSPEKNPTTVQFLDKDIDLETKELTTRKSDKPSKGILTTLRHRSPFHFRSKDAVIIEQEPSPPPPPPPIPPAQTPPPKETKQKVVVPPSTKPRSRLVELQKIPRKASSSYNTSRKTVNVTPITDTTGSSLVRRTSGLKDLIHKFETVPPKPKRFTTDNLSSNRVNQDEKISSDHLNGDQRQQTSSLASTNKSKTIDIPDLLRNVEKDPPTISTQAILRHSNLSRQGTSFDSATSMFSTSECIATANSGTRKPTSTARPLMLSVVS